MEGMKSWEHIIMQTDWSDWSLDYDQAKVAYIYCHVQHMPFLFSLRESKAAQATHTPKVLFKILWSAGNTRMVQFNESYSLILKIKGWYISSSLRMQLAWQILCCPSSLWHQSSFAEGSKTVKGLWSVFLLSPFMTEQLQRHSLLQTIWQRTKNGQVELRFCMQKVNRFSCQHTH